MSKFNEAYQNYIKLKELGLVEKFPEVDITLVSVFIADCPQVPLLAPEPEPVGRLPYADAVKETQNVSLVCPLEEFSKGGFKPKGTSGLLRKIREVYFNHFGKYPEYKKADPTKKGHECEFIVEKKWLDKQWPVLEKQYPDHFENKNPSYGLPTAPKDVLPT